ncbi:hypothetical protein [Calothrix sp. 336/3]|uniref:hypothetical protein n=1 Tax=Calothrix sp. 336/3 TaxID=1337936 RepID=UPI0004E4530C|nr:hypothetical protein [Calothrix sp. 336/3]AKG23557.1 hypothetical protein IJ00_21760 [Calothrix sp. 336/3]
MTDKLFQVIAEALNKPPLPYDPGRQSFKQWVMYCLRDRGFIISYAQNADFALEQKGRDKIYFQVASNLEDVKAGKSAWIVWDSAAKMITVTPPQDS